MESSIQAEPRLQPAEPLPSPEPIAPPPPPAASLTWTASLLAVVIILATTAYLGQHWLPPRLRAVLGVLTFLLIPLGFCRAPRALNRHTILWGMILQLCLALFILKVEIFGYRPGYELFNALAQVAHKFLEFTRAGSSFVFGPLADPETMGKAMGPGKGFVFVCTALPTIIFVASFFTVLYHLGVLQLVVRGMAWVMSYLMRTSGAETLSVTANVVMGQTEAPLIVKPYVARMTDSELLALMVGGMAHISGGLMAVYIGMKADAVGIIATSVMASPCSLYLTKILFPETGKPQTLGEVKAPIERNHVNVIDAAASGASDGMRLAINVTAMLIAFLAFIAMFDYLLGLISPGLTLAGLLGLLFSPFACLLGVESGDTFRVGELLGLKLAANEFVAYTRYEQFYDMLSPRSRILATYALTGFANVASIGIQIGGIGAIAPSRRGDLARLGGWALLIGFLVTLLNAALAGIFLD